MEFVAFLMRGGGQRQTLKLALECEPPPLPNAEQKLLLNLGFLSLSTNDVCRLRSSLLLSRQLVEFQIIYRVGKSLLKHSLFTKQKRETPSEVKMLL